MRKRRKQVPGKVFKFKCGHSATLPLNRGETTRYATWYTRQEESPGWGCRKCANKRADSGRLLNPRRHLYYKAKMYARLYHREIDISLSDIPEIPEHCPVFPWIKILVRIGHRHRSDSSPSLDRIDSSKGYVKGNIRIISWRANLLKNNGTLQEFEALAADEKLLQRR